MHAPKLWSCATGAVAAPHSRLVVVEAAVAVFGVVVVDVAVPAHAPVPHEFDCPQVPVGDQGQWEEHGNGERGHVLVPHDVAVAHAEIRHADSVPITQSLQICA